MPSTLRSILCALAVVLTALPAAGQSMTEVQRYLLAASRMYENLEYERALDQLKRAKSAASGVADDAIIDRYEGIVLFDMGKRDEALAAFREALYLEPDAALPVKVSPKITEAFEQIRTAVKKELAPILAKKKEEEELARLDAETRAKRTAEEAARAEQTRKETAEKEAKLRIEAEEARKRADDAQRQKLADLQRREDEARAAEARLAEARRLLAEDERKAEERKKEAQKFAIDRPEKRDLVPPPGKEPIAAVAARPLSPAPFVLGGVTVAAGAVAGIFAYLADQELAKAKAATYQDETIRALEPANRNALITNIALGVAGGAAIATIVAAIAGSSAPPPPAPTSETTP